MQVLSRLAKGFTPKCDMEWPLPDGVPWYRAEEPCGQSGGGDAGAPPQVALATTRRRLHTKTRLDLRLLAAEPAGFDDSDGGPDCDALAEEEATNGA